ncbi:uncharacterized protein [Onthophagus taurus]|uniref:uncharacterized protein n=1 Tax=Onthophagus taurus TaxID=166361 RepID=UPI000C1FF4DB|nr:uncharacterized protein LOC111419034 [Onthophagus taurus]
MKSFWKQETDTINSPCISAEDRACEDHFNESHIRLLNGQFMVRLPFKKSPKELGSSYQPALNMFNHLEMRFAKNLNFKTEYIKFMSEYLKLDHMILIPLPSIYSTYYLPHHGVIRESSTTTKLRVVFNGSQKTSNNISLNDCLYTGPKLQTELLDIILRWRCYAMVFSCDLEKMYRQIRVHPDDCSCQRILWREDPSNPIQIYQLSTVTYGLA